jgi:hypothetical protein
MVWPFFGCFARKGHKKTRRAFAVRGAVKPFAGHKKTASRAVLLFGARCALLIQERQDAQALGLAFAVVFACHGLFRLWRRFWHGRWSAFCLWGVVVGGQVPRTGLCLCLGNRGM